MKRTILFCSIAAILLFIASFYYFNVINGFLFSFFDKSNLSFFVTEINGTFLLAFKLCMSIALIPMFLLLIWLVGNIGSVKSRVFSIIIMLACIIIAVGINVFLIQSHDITMTNWKRNVSFPLEKVFFEYAIFLGAAVGSIISYFIFKRAKINKEQNIAISQIGK
jgi:hypothetical protein